MTAEEKESFILEQYNNLITNNNKHNSQILYNLISAKVKFRLYNVGQTLYLDVKNFILSYISSVDEQDYGYDEVILSKIMDVVSNLDLEQQYSIMCLTRRMFFVRGYDIENVLKVIAEIERKVAWKKGQYFRFIRLLMSSSFVALLITLLGYVIIVSCVLLPAPLECMEIFEIELRNYSSCWLVNHLINTLTLLIGKDNIAPSIIPIGTMGVLVYSIGSLLFYLFIVNYVFKKIENLIIK